MSSYLDRYLNGEHVQVWDELIALGDTVRTEAIFPDAYAVAQEIMRRVRANVEILVPRLESIGYRFGDASYLDDYKGVLLPPIPDVTERILEFESTCAPIPLALRACCEIVGHVDFRGKAPENWTGIHDELVIEGTGVFDYFSEWGECGEEDNLVLQVGLFPDLEFKRGGNGIGMVAIEVPNSDADSPLYIDLDTVYPFGESLVEYLRVSILNRGGFPCHPCPEWVLSQWGPDEMEPEYRGHITHLDYLIDGLIPF